MPFYLISHRRNSPYEIQVVVVENLWLIGTVLVRKAKRAKKVESSVNEFKIAEKNSQRKKEQVHPAVMRKGRRKVRR